MTKPFHDALTAYFQAGGSENYLDRFWGLVRGTEDALTLCLPYLDFLGTHGLLPQQMVESEKGLPQTVEDFKANPKISLPSLASATLLVLGQRPELIGMDSTDRYFRGVILEELHRLKISE